MIMMIILINILKTPFINMFELMCCARDPRRNNAPTVRLAQQGCRMRMRGVSVGPTQAGWCPADSLPAVFSTGSEGVDDGDEGEDRRELSRLRQEVARLREENRELRQPRAGAQ
jgi:hypothetical protein